MAHNINFNEQTGKHSFFSVQQKAWHGLGQIVEQYPTSEEAIRHAGLDYEVIKSPLFTKGSGIICCIAPCFPLSDITLSIVVPVSCFSVASYISIVITVVYSRLPPIKAVACCYLIKV